MNWFLLGRTIRLAFFLRVPLLTLLLLAVLGPVSQFTSARTLLGNLFDQQNDAGSIWRNAFVVSFGAFLLAFTAITAINLLLHYGVLRFSDDPSSPRCFDVSQKRPGLTFTLGTLAALVLVVTVMGRTGWSYWPLTLSAALAAFVGACVMALLAKVVQLTLTNADITPYPPPYLIFPVNRWPFLRRPLDNLYCWPPPGAQSRAARFVRRIKGHASSVAQWPFEIIAGAGQGYLATVSTPAGNRLKLRSGHVFALTLAILALATYVIVGYNKSYIRAEPASIPALAYVLLFLIVACWFFSALAFFVDRYRFPLLASVIVLGSFTATVPQSDHFFRVETPVSVSRLRSMSPDRFLTPAQYLTGRANGLHPKVVLIATPGGGIQAAAWTAEVLARLDRMLPARNGQPGFRQSVSLISSVSGGSLGAMIYAASFAGDVSPDCVAQNARVSAIDEVAWGLTDPDFWRAILPLFRPDPEMDRGWALEQKWAVVNGLSPAPACAICETREKPPCAAQRTAAIPVAADDTYLSDWAARGTAMPALILNATLVERGQHVVFSTTRFPERNDPRGIVNFYDLYPHAEQPFDVRVNTAARLSASFPYVAPAARPNLKSPYAGDFHFVDGGYYDNLGVDALIGWVASAYGSDPALRERLPQIFILQIRHFNPKAESVGKRAGWSFQLFAPLSALLNMWNTAPIHRDRNELDLFREDFANRVSIQSAVIPYCGIDYREPGDHAKAFAACMAAGTNGRIQPSPFLAARATSRMRQKQIDCADPPLSWKLTEAQKWCIDETWRAFNSYTGSDPTGALASLRKFLYAP